LNNLNAIFDQVNFLLESQESEYLVYTKQGMEEKQYGLGFAISIFLYLGVLVVIRKIRFQIEKYTIIKIVLVALLFLILGLSVQLATRLNYYIFPLIVSAYSLTLLNLKKYKFDTTPVFSILSTYVIVLFFAYQNYMFWQSEVYAPYFTEYKTILQSPLLK
jgi:hypothetical protein